MAVAGNAFSKKYLTELLTQQIKEAEEPAASSAADEARAELLKMERWNLIDRVEMLAEHQKVIDDSVAYLKALDREKFVNAESTDKKAHEALYKLQGFIDRIHSSEAHRYEGRYDYAARSEQKRIIQQHEQERAKQAWSTAGNRIERMKKVLDYVEKAPTEEFSLALMRGLGFLDIIKAAISGR